MKDQSTSKKTAKKKPNYESRENMKRKLEKQKAELPQLIEPVKVEETKSPGQPTKYDPKYCQMLIEHMASGLSFETFGAEIEVVKKTLYNWCDEHKEFLHAKGIGELRCQKYHEMIGISGQSGHLPGFQQSAWRFNMANRFGWRDRSDVTSDGKGLPPTNVNLVLPRNGYENPEDVDKG